MTPSTPTDYFPVQSIDNKLQVIIILYNFRMLSKVARRGLSSSAACAGRIKVAKPVVEMDGDEMTRIIWEKVRFRPSITLAKIF